MAVSLIIHFGKSGRRTRNLRWKWSREPHQLLHLKRGQDRQDLLQQWHGHVLQVFCFEDRGNYVKSPSNLRRKRVRHEQVGRQQNIQTTWTLTRRLAAKNDCFVNKWPAAKCSMTTTREPVAKCSTTWTRGPAKTGASWSWSWLAAKVVRRPAKTLFVISRQHSLWKYSAKKEFQVFRETNIVFSRTCTVWKITIKRNFTQKSMIWTLTLLFCLSQSFFSLS